jgi:hypothetical protein
MGTVLRRVIGPLTAAIILPGILVGQSTTRTPIKTSICELARAPERFNGSVVRIRAEFVSKFQWAGFMDDACAAKIPVGVYHVLDDLKPNDGQYAFTATADNNEHPETLRWKPIEPPRPVHLEENDDYRAFRKYADRKFRWPDGGICRDCPLYRVTVTATGRFDYFEKQTVAVRANANTKASIRAAGDPNAPLFRFVLESVSDVSVIPIDPAIYSTGKRRTVSLEEAHDLVYAYLKSIGCNEQTCGLEPNHDSYWPQFYSFQAIRDNPGGSGNMGFYAVDPQTSDVFSGVICGVYSSPSLLRLQRTIRHDGGPDLLAGNLG